MPPGLANHSVKVKILVVTLSSRMRKISMLIFEILQLIRENEGIPTFEYSHSELYGFFVVTGTALSVISCIDRKSVV